MSDFTGIVVLIAAIACLFLGQRKSAPIATRRQYSLMGCASSVLIAVEAARRSEYGIAVIFALAVVASLVGLVMDHLKTTNTDA